MSRVKNNEDLLRHLLCSSDPYTSSLKKPVSNPYKIPLPHETIQLLKSSSSIMLSKFHFFNGTVLLFSFELLYTIIVILAKEFFLFQQ